MRFSYYNFFDEKYCLDHEIGLISLKGFNSWFITSSWHRVEFSTIEVIWNEMILLIFIFFLFYLCFDDDHELVWLHVYLS
jgi:hypothetical protein